MSYHLHTTPAFILKSRSSGEASKVITLFTRELGLLEAHAQGVRKLQSKLRSSLQDMSFIRVSLVRGREFWRITSAEKLPELEGISESRPKKIVTARVFSLLKRFIVGEQADQKLFEVVREALYFLAKSHLSPRDISHFEIIVVLRILYHLGYLSKEGDLEPFLSSEEWNKILLETIVPLRRQALLSINTSFGESQL